MKKDGRNAILLYFVVFLTYLNDVDSSACYLDGAFADREKRVISAHLDIFTRKEFRAALPDNNTARFGDLARIEFHTPVFRVAVSAVSC